MDEESILLARALQAPPEAVERALADVGVDAPYLAQALLDGDPQGAIAAVSARLGVPRRELAIALTRAAPRASPAPGERARLARAAVPLLRRLALAGAVLAALAASLGVIAFAQPDLFREIVVMLAGGFLLLAAAALAFASWHAARVARRLARER